MAQHNHINRLLKFSFSYEVQSFGIKVINLTRQLIMMEGGDNSDHERDQPVDAFELGQVAAQQLQGSLAHVPKALRQLFEDSEFKSAINESGVSNERQTLTPLTKYSVETPKKDNCVGAVTSITVIDDPPSIHQDKRLAVEFLSSTKSKPSPRKKLSSLVKRRMTEKSQPETSPVPFKEDELISPIPEKRCRLEQTQAAVGLSKNLRFPRDRQISWKPVHPDRSKLTTLSYEEMSSSAQAKIAEAKIIEWLQKSPAFNLSNRNINGAAATWEHNNCLICKVGPIEVEIGPLILLFLNLYDIRGQPVTGRGEKTTCKTCALRLVEVLRVGYESKELGSKFNVPESANVPKALSSTEKITEHQKLEPSTKDSYADKGEKRNVERTMQNEKSKRCVENLSGGDEPVLDRASSTPNLLLCPICGKLFSSYNGLQSHKEVCHHEDKPRHRCNVCKRVCATPSHLLIHMKTHSGEKDFKCRFCDKSFTQAQNRKDHELRHSENKPFECLICHRRFYRVTFARSHMQKTHPEIDGRKIPSFIKKFTQHY